MRVLVISQSGADPAAAQLLEHFRKHLGHDGPGVATFGSYEKLLQLTGNGTTVVSGLIYAPAAPVTLKGLLAVGIDTLGGVMSAIRLR